MTAMHAIYLIVLLIAVLALNWRRLGLHRIASFGGRACRWKRDGSRQGASLTRYVCATCGVDAYTSDGRAPRQCKRAYRDGGL